ncbi:MAG TPA: arabinan endo-1,5-alpha-L-arabinosidase [Pyrinomonadaceae bacterium]|nr:arabinan endo-1,5-alpha-L-arabinosidase [Pyrinomonadaceae bacterium]
MRGENSLRLTGYVAGCLLLLLSLHASGQKGGASKALEPVGDVRNVHDPTVIEEGGKYYIFSTRAGIAVRCSEDLVRWRLCGDVFGHLPGWAVEDVKGLRGLWAPDVSYFNGKYHLYYSASTFGSNRSSIGLVTNRTLDSASDKYRWEDQGKVISSVAADDWNAIDPNIVLDEDGQPWLSFGSFWSGIKMRKIDLATGKLSTADQTLYALASRPRTKEQPGAIEAPAILRKNGYYYLFVSFDFCCKGVNSTYNIRVGRSRKVTGPYVDRSGKPMMEDGGTILLAGSGRWRGPGHCAILQEKGGEKLVYHAYDAEARGIPTLRIAPLNWDAEGWPAVK